MNLYQGHAMSKLYLTYYVCVIVCCSWHFGSLSEYTFLLINAYMYSICKYGKLRRYEVFERKTFIVCFREKNIYLTLCKIYLLNISHAIYILNLVYCRCCKAGPIINESLQALFVQMMQTTSPLR